MSDNDARGVKKTLKTISQMEDNGKNIILIQQPPLMTNIVRAGYSSSFVWEKARNNDLTLFWHIYPYTFINTYI
jgi:hypothetical protein